MRILVLHGPNLNLLGTREPHIYGATSLEEIDRELQSSQEASVECRQSNHEGQLIDWIHEAAASGVDGLLVNFGGLSHNSISLADALKATALPTVEVHVSNIHAREAFRQTTYTGGRCRGRNYRIWASQLPPWLARSHRLSHRSQAVIGSKRKTPRWTSI